MDLRAVPQGLAAVHDLPRARATPSMWVHVVPSSAVRDLSGPPPPSGCSPPPALFAGMRRGAVVCVPRCPALPLSALGEQRRGTRAKGAFAADLGGALAGPGPRQVPSDCVPE